MADRGERVGHVRASELLTWRREGNGMVAPRAERHRRRQAWHLSRIDGAVHPGDRISAAADYLRATLAELPPGIADEVATEVVTTIVDAVERVEATR